MTYTSCCTKIVNRGSCRIQTLQNMYTLTDINNKKTLFFFGYIIRETG